MANSGTRASGSRVSTGLATYVVTGSEQTYRTLSHALGGGCYNSDWTTSVQAAEVYVNPINIR